MPTLFRRSNGVFYIAYSIEGKRRWKSTRETQQHLAIKALLNFNKLLSSPTKKILLSKFMEEFLASATTNFSAGTVRIYKQSLSSFLSLTGDMWLGSVTPKHIDCFKTHRAKSVSPVTLNIELRTLKAAFYTAMRWKLVMENPFKHVPLLRVPEEQPMYLTKEGFQKLVSVISEKWFRDLVIVAAFTGLRRGELLNLRWKHIDFERRVIYINSDRTFRTKTGKRRTVPMNQEVVQILQNKIQYSQAEHVFSRNGMRLVESSISHKFKASINRANLDKQLRFHSLRHTFATWLVQSGVNIYEVQKLLGHSNIKITEVYSHLATGELHLSVDRIRFPISA